VVLATTRTHSCRENNEARFTFRRHAPRKRGIQYAEAFGLKHDVSGMLYRPVDDDREKLLFEIQIRNGARMWQQSALSAEPKTPSYRLISSYP
jgi:hypothetical protein